MGDECPQGIFSYCAKYFSDRTLDQMYVSLWFWTTNFFLSKHFISFLHGILFLSIVPVHNWMTVFSRGHLPRVGRTDVQWSQIRFSGSEPRVVGSSWRSFPVWWRLLNHNCICTVTVFFLLLVIQLVVPDCLIDLPERSLSDTYSQCQSTWLVTALWNMWRHVNMSSVLSGDDTFHMKRLWPNYLACRFNLTLSSHVQRSK